MLNENIPLTREHYIDLAYAGEPPDPWTYEHEAELPDPLQRPELLQPPSGAARSPLFQGGPSWAEGLKRGQQVQEGADPGMALEPPQTGDTGSVGISPARPVRGT